MTAQNQVYKCLICGNIIEVLHPAGGELVCCGKPMNLMAENTEDGAAEKHIPVIEKSETGIIVRVGEISHPMDDDHYIEWIEIIASEKTCKKYLKPGNAPEAKFCSKATDFEVRAYCNLHGLWKSIQ